jgi:hypothetical protein
MATRQTVQQKPAMAIRTEIVRVTKLAPRPETVRRRTLESWMRRQVAAGWGWRTETELDITPPVRQGLIRHRRKRLVLIRATDVDPVLAPARAGFSNAGRAFHLE